MFAESVNRILGTDTMKKEVPALLEQPSLGQMKGVQETVHVDDAKPMFFKPRAAPFHIRAQPTNSTQF